MKRAFTVAYIVITLLVLGYVAYPSPAFPDPPPDSVRSTEPADSETELRRAYFTNYSRADVIEHYRQQFTQLPTLRLNYPPEDAVFLIRDQTRSTYLEELVHPLRESLFINGFEPQVAKDEIWYKGEHFEQKITVRYVPSSSISRVAVYILVSAVLFVVFNQWFYTIINFSRKGRNKT